MWSNASRVSTHHDRLPDDGDRSGRMDRPLDGGDADERVEGPLFEYACHEGNYAVPNMLAYSRAEEAP